MDAIQNPSDVFSSKSLTFESPPVDVTEDDRQLLLDHYKKLKERKKQLDPENLLLTMALEEDCRKNQIAEAFYVTDEERLKQEHDAYWSTVRKLLNLKATREIVFGRGDPDKKEMETFISEMNEKKKVMKSGKAKMKTFKINEILNYFYKILIIF
jgi:hypothetical protein